MKILLLSTSMGMGGADKLLLTAARAMQGHGHAVRIVSLTPLGPMGQEARSLGIPTDSLEMRRGVPDVRALFRLARMAREWCPDVVHSHMVHANLMARALRLLVRVPVLVSTIHNIYEGGALLMAGYRLTNGLVDHITIVSEAAAERFVNERIVPRELLTVVPNGVDTDLFAQIPAGSREALRAEWGVGNEFVWLAVGRFEIAKDYPNMLRAFARVRESMSGARLMLVGRGSLQNETQQLVTELGLESSVRFLGVQSQIPAIMNAADGFVLSSAWEGMPMVLLEAAAAGLPIVATQVGGNHEVVREGESGYLVPPRDADALAAAMQRLMRLSESERRAMGARGREYVRTHYGLHRVADRWEGLYQEVLGRKNHLAAASRPAMDRVGSSQVGDTHPDLPSPGGAGGQR
ncbi:MAG TPA: glycosyltransferase [Gemmatimonadales bacterium]|nr:glycosyltransferase [Gemmatimonadales bacterium]